MDQYLQVITGIIRLNLKYILYYKREGYAQEDGDNVYVCALIHVPSRSDNAILVGFSGGFAQYPLSSVSECYDGDLICLRRRAVNNPNPSLQSERVVV